MTSKVFFHDAKGTPQKNRLEKLRELFERAGMDKIISPGDAVAIKLHWGEPGNVGFLPVPYARTVVDAVREAGGVPFVTDTNTLYTGMRRNAPDNIRAAAQNGYSLETLGAPVIVADGIKGFDYREVPCDKAPGGMARIASGIADADAMIVLTHVKSHMLFGVGGTLKNLGMGCTTPAGKQFLHSDLKPRVDMSKCDGDALCVRRCPEKCIEMIDRPDDFPGRSRKVAFIHQDRCIGCGECTSTCPHEAIPIRWKTSSEGILFKTAEYALASVREKKGKVGYLNCLINITPDCDCCDWNEPPFVSDVGFCASLDPVAVDMASADLVANTKPVPGSKASEKDGDPWRAIYDIPYRKIFDYAEKIGLGSTDYELIKLR